MLDKNGHELCDQTTMELPSGFKRPETLAEQVQRLVRTTVSREAHLAGAETFEESEDFDVGDETDPATPYEAHFDPILGKEITADEFRQNQEVYRKRYVDAQSAYYASLDREALMEGNAPPAPLAEPLRPPPATVAVSRSI